MSTARGPTHLYDPSRGSLYDEDATACGAPGKHMSRHELKRGRITCPACLQTLAPTDPDKEEDRDT